MSDVLDNERDPAPFWVVPVAMLAVVAIVVTLAWRWNDGRGTPAPTASTSPPSGVASPTGAPLPSPRVAGNACGGDIEQPLIDAAAAPPRTGLRILVGDRDLRLLDVNAGTTKVLATRPDRRSFTELTQTATQVLAVLRDPCSADGYGKGVIAAVDPESGALTPRGAGDVVLPGEPPSVLDFDAEGSMAVRDLGRSTSTPVPPGWLLQARTHNGYFASVSGPDNAPPSVGVGRPSSSGRLTTTFGSGNVVAASPELLFWLAGDCPGVHCLLTWTTTEGTNTAQAIDTYGWGGVVSPDGTKLAFRKQRATGQLGEHPGPPNDVAIVDLGQGGPIRVLPGLVLPAKAGLTLAWSPDSEWLVIGADLGTGPAVLLWREGTDRPALVPIPPTGGGTTGPPALLVLPR
jgi:hypothetical protein